MSPPLPSLCPHLSQPLLQDAGELLLGVGWEVQQLGAAGRVGSQPGQAAVCQVQSIGQPCRVKEKG